MAPVNRHLNGLRLAEGVVFFRLHRPLRAAPANMQGDLACHLGGHHELVSSVEIHAVHRLTEDGLRDGGRTFPGPKGTTVGL